MLSVWYVQVVSHLAWRACTRMRTRRYAQGALYVLSAAAVAATLAEASQHGKNLLAPHAPTTYPEAYPVNEDALVGTLLHLRLGGSLHYYDLPLRVYPRTRVDERDRAHNQHFEQWKYHLAKAAKQLQGGGRGGLPVGKSLSITLKELREENQEAHAFPASSHRAHIHSWTTAPLCTLTDSSLWRAHCMCVCHRRAHPRVGWSVSISSTHGSSRGVRALRATIRGPTTRPAHVPARLGA